MKKVIIIILAVLLALDIGVLTYAATRGPSVTFDGNAVGLKEKPAKSVYEGAETWNDLEKILAISDKAKMGATLLLETTYNLIESTGFYVLYKTNIVAESGESSYSENFRAVQGSNEVYQTLTSSSGFEKRQIKYYNEEILQSDFFAEYEASTGKFNVKLNTGKSKIDKEGFSKKGKSTYVLRSWFDFPLYLGGKDKAANAGDLVWDSIDGSSVMVKDESDYYTVTFSAAVDKTNAYEDEYHYLSYGSLGGDQIGGGKVNHINSLTIEVNVWKSGLFRDITTTADMTGELGGQTGNATVTKTFEFSYADQDVSTAYWLRSLGWYIFLKNPDDIVKYEEEVAVFEK